jgi:hypothetical protein
VTIGLAALIIALCSFIWNIIDAVHSWRTSAPLVKVTLTSEHSEGYEALGINVRNIGGSPIAAVALYVWFEHSMRSKRGWELNAGNDSDARDDREIIGPLLPVTINGHHAERWKFDMASRLNSRVLPVFPD